MSRVAIVRQGGLVTLTGLALGLGAALAGGRLIGAPLGREPARSARVRGNDGCPADGGTAGVLAAGAAGLEAQSARGRARGHVAARTGGSQLPGRFACAARSIIIPQ